MPEPRRPLSLKRAERVLTRNDFERIYKTGARVRTWFGTVFLRPNGLAHMRLGIAATRKLGGAVVRNRAKRIVRELFRQQKVACGYDIVVVPNRSLLDASRASLASEYGRILERRLRA